MKAVRRVQFIDNELRDVAPYKVFNNIPMVMELISIILVFSTMSFLIIIKSGCLFEETSALWC